MVQFFIWNDRDSNFFFAIFLNEKLPQMYEFNVCFSRASQDEYKGVDLNWTILSGQISTQTVTNELFSYVVVI